MNRTRRYDIDALRVFAFGLLILYHTGMAYVWDWDFHIKSAYTAEWLQWPMIFMNRWRMSLLFLISGIAIALAAPERKLLRFARDRTWRLMLPLIFGMFVVVPIQPYCEGVAGGHLQPGFWRFLLAYWHVHPWPQDSFSGWQYGITWNHLWYLPYLWAYTLALIVLMPLLGRDDVRRTISAFTRSPMWLFLLLPALPQWLCAWFLDPRFPSTHAFFGDWANHAKYATVFLSGYLLARKTAFWDRVVAARRTTLVVALVSVTVYLGLRLISQIHWGPDFWMREVPYPVWVAIALVAQSLYLWATLLTILGWGKAWLNRPFRWLPYCTEAVYPWYMLHQSLIVPLVFLLKPLSLGPWLEPALVVGGTVAGCHLIYEYGIRRVGLLRPLFGLKRLPPAKPAPTEDAPALPG
ncbi:MAG: hypothetical protein GAK28_03103 [Luteibacter sp.]|uniref:acyltransferase family protein n=1 Tax=Luteibacter sp. TaxID=1886636 RepID=UPI0013840424|nr:acyltransferase family protein [Luteibacter sp.]KAF1005621.1 MAG: hypothetical protein GAK28_03103 [Luteibacter sp.]